MTEAAKAKKLRAGLADHFEKDLLARFRGAGPARRKAINEIAKQAVIVMEMEHKAVIHDRPDEAITVLAAESRKLAGMLKALSSPDKIAGSKAVAVVARAYLTTGLALDAEPPAGSA